MPLFRYEAVTVAGELVRGEMEAADQGAVIARVQASGQLPIRAEPAPERRSRLVRGRARGIGRREVGLFTRELASLLHAGLPLDRALQVIVEVSQDAPLQRLAAGIQEAVRGGAALSNALDAHEEAFGRFYVSMIRAAEASGKLDAGLARLADYEERSKALKDSVISALIYPSILVVVSGISRLIILAYVVPSFTQLFADAGRALPLPTQVVMAVAEVVRSYWWLMGAAFVVAALPLRALLATPAGRYWWDGLLLRLPLAGGLIRRVQMARFSRSLGTLLAAGVTLLAALSIVKDIIANRVLSEALEPAAEALKAGRGLAEPLMASALFPALGLQLIKIGEESGRLDEMLLRVADLYDREVAAATSRILALLEPVLIVGLGVVIAAVIMSILVAIVSINDLPL
jgi:general secretion pathway protein F